VKRSDASKVILVQEGEATSDRSMASIQQIKKRKKRTEVAEANNPFITYQI
jgi:hypothetical protein